MADLFAIVLAGGPLHRSTGTPRVLFEVHGVPLLGHALNLIERFGPKEIVVVAGEGSVAIRKWVGDRARVIEQKDMFGSGHAVGLGLEALSGREGGLLVTYADRVLMREESVRSLMAGHTPSTAASLLSVRLERPAGYARIIRDENGRVTRGSGDCDLRASVEADIREVVAGAYWFDLRSLRAALSPPSALKDKYNLTECLELLVQAGGDVLAIPLKDPREARGVYSEEDAKSIEGESLTPSLARAL